MSYKEVLQIQKRLSNISNFGTGQEQVLGLLRVLQTLNINIDVLASTQISILVRQLRRRKQDREVSSLAKTIIKKWRCLVEKARANNVFINIIRLPLDADDFSALPKMMTEKSSSSSFKEEKREKDEKQNVEYFPSATNVLLLLAYGMKDAIRTKCRQMLCNAIKFDDGIPKGCTDFEKLAAELEDAIYNVFRNIDKKYIRRIRSRVFNLKDPKNPALRLNYIRGVVSPKTLATMTPEEMASDEMKQIRQNLKKKTIKCGYDCKF